MKRKVKKSEIKMALKRLVKELTGKIDKHSQRVYDTLGVGKKEIFFWA